MAAFKSGKKVTEVNNIKNEEKEVDEIIEEPSIEQPPTENKPKKKSFAEKLEDVKNQKVYEIAEKHDLKNDSAMVKKIHSRVWKCLKNRFSIPRYNELPICEFENGVGYIQKLTFKDLF